MIKMENGAEFVNGHNQLFLPLRNPALIIPNNRTRVDKKANYLKKQFMKNKKFFEDYQKFINDILQKGYARDDITIEAFWTDSQVPLSYKRNQIRRFKTFVANSIQKIKDHSDVAQWKICSIKKQSCRLWVERFRWNLLSNNQNVI